MAKKLLVADDSVTIQKVIKLALSSEGYDILAVSDGTAAIQAIEAERPDAVLIDVALPAANAYEVKEAINRSAHLAGVGFILMSSAFERVDEAQAQKFTFHGRLIKPFDPAHLRKTVASVLASARPAAAVASAPEPAVHLTAPKLSPVSHENDEGEDADDLPPVVDLMPTIEATQAPADEETEPDFMTPRPGVFRPEPATVVRKPVENDIKDLTESTIKMSGLDDFEWSMDDSRKMIEPTKTIEVTRSQLSAPQFEVSTKIIDDGGSNFLSTAKGIPSPAAPPPMQAQPHPQLNRAELESLVKREFEVVIERLAREMVPQIAEQIIRKEIEKILAEG